MKLILVDDEEMIRLGMEKILSKSELNLQIVGSFSNGLMALMGLDKLNINDLDVVITDIKMPGMDGLKFIEKLSEAAPQVEIIILSGFNDFEYARQAMRFGVKDYFLKPVDKFELFEVLKRISDQKQENIQELKGMERVQEPQEQHEHYVIEPLKQIIEKEYNKMLDLESLSERLGFSTSYLSKHFKQETGSTITDYLIQIRIQKAKQFIDDHPNLKIYEIAHLVGYPDPVYFNKLFKKIVLLTPKEYKDRSRLKGLL
ncbi:response regulator [Paenibacillus psychroresistens]|uniref:Response regulator n=1 Tax=Paenibacillus psychroresistens TaxID=1778678 RepID=A0A6B8RHE9_9BACL|nr:response regulator [Paenibacillus psychroresistens]QGQ94808.1 response regulator [Paenibacillus psychroresistens]